MSRELIEEYGEEVRKLCERLTETLSESLGLKPNTLMQALGGGDKVGASLRTNFYPKCPQPQLTLGLSSHSDPGGITILLPDEKVAGLQVRRGDGWITIKSVPNALIVNIGDQLQVLFLSFLNLIVSLKYVNYRKSICFALLCVLLSLSKTTI